MREQFDLDRVTDHELPFWQRPIVGERDIDDAVIWDLRENLELVLPYVERLLETIPGKIVVTSDHRNMMRLSLFPVPVREYGHPDGICTPELVTVPWDVYTNGARREIITGHGTDSDRQSNEDRVTERLEHLGCKK